MGVAREAATLATAGLVEELKAEGEEEGEDELDKRFGAAYESKVGRLIVEIDGDGTVVAGRVGGLSHVSSPCRWLSVKMRHRERNVWKDQASYEGVTPLPHNPLECGKKRRPSCHETDTGCASGLGNITRRASGQTSCDLTDKMPGSAR